MPFRKIVLVSVQDEGFTNIGIALKQLQRMGGYRISYGYRGSYALIGYAGGRAPWVKQQQRRRKRGPSAVYVKLSRLPGISI